MPRRFAWRDSSRSPKRSTWASISAAARSYVYQVEQPLPRGFQMDKMIAALNRRVNPAGVTDVTIRAIGTERVEITLPHASAQEVEHYERVLTSVGSLEFDVLANRRDHPELIAQGGTSFPGPVVENGRARARWVPIAAAAQADFSPGGEIAIRNRNGKEYVPGRERPLPRDRRLLATGQRALSTSRDSRRSAFTSTPKAPTASRS